jgi:hypothetical protein
VRLQQASRLIGLLASLALPASAADRPNIVFIMSDDHAAHAIGAYGSRVNRTPNIDRLKKALRDEDQFANEQLPNGVDGPVATLRGK